MSTDTITGMRNQSPASLRRYWFEFDRSASNEAFVSPWWGVTAFGLDDATSILRTHRFKAGLPPVTKLIEDVDVSTLDENHVLRNMGAPNLRGIWYPLGFDY